MPKYRKKPVVIEAFQLFKRTVEHDWYSIPDWVRAAYERGDILFPDSGFHVKTLEGRMEGKWGDYLIQGVQKELYPCKADVFFQTYEPADETSEEEKPDAQTQP